MDRYLARYYAPRVSTMRLHTPAYTPAKTSINVYFVYSMIAAFLYYEVIPKRKNKMAALEFEINRESSRNALFKPKKKEASKMKDKNGMEFD